MVLTLPLLLAKDYTPFRSTRDSVNSPFLSQVQAFQSTPLPLTQPYVAQNKTNLSPPVSFYLGQPPMISKSLYCALILASPALPDLVREPPWLREARAAMLQCRAESRGQYWVYPREKQYFHDSSSSSALRHRHTQAMNTPDYSR